MIVQEFLLYSLLHWFDCVVVHDELILPDDDHQIV